MVFIHRSSLAVPHDRNLAETMTRVFSQRLFGRVMYAVFGNPVYARRTLRSGWSYRSWDRFRGISFEYINRLVVGDAITAVRLHGTRRAWQMMFRRYGTTNREMVDRIVRYTFQTMR